MDSNRQNLINKIKYRAQYRGTKEMDLFVYKFVNEIVENLNLEELEDLNKLINLGDEELIKISESKDNQNLSKVIIKLREFKKKILMAERLGFEPRKELPLCRFSRPVLSTAQPSLRELGFISINIYFNNKIDKILIKIFLIIISLWIKKVLTKVCS